MKLSKLIAFPIVSVFGLLFMVDVAVAQYGADSVLSDSLQTDRMTVLEVDRAAGRIVCLNGTPERIVHELHNGALVITPEGPRADLRFLNAGDIIKAELRDGRIDTIVILRRASDELASPEQ